MGPSASPVGCADDVGPFHERFDQHGPVVVSLGPVPDQLATDQGQEMRSEVGDFDPAAE